MSSKGNSLNNSTYSLANCSLQSTIWANSLTLSYNSLLTGSYT